MKRSKRLSVRTKWVRTSNKLAKYWCFTSLVGIAYWIGVIVFVHQLNLFASIRQHANLISPLPPKIGLQVERMEQQYAIRFDLSWMRWASVIIIVYRCDVGAYACVFNCKMWIFIYHHLHSISSDVKKSIVAITSDIHRA